MDHGTPGEVYASWLRILKPGGRIVVFDSGHNKDNFLTKFDHNNEAYREEYRQKFGREPAVSFEQGQYEAARGWKRELKLTYESRPGMGCGCVGAAGLQKCALGERSAADIL